MVTLSHRNNRVILVHISVVTVTKLTVEHFLKQKAETNKFLPEPTRKETEKL